MHKIYNNLYWYRRYDENGNEKTYRTANPNGNRFHFDFADLQVLFFDHEKKNNPKRRTLWKCKSFFNGENFKAEENKPEKYIEN